jgi:hypothetical protein
MAAGDLHDRVRQKDGCGQQAGESLAEKELAGQHTY